MSYTLETMLMIKKHVMIFFVICLVTLSSCHKHLPKKSIKEIEKEIDSIKQMKNWKFIFDSNIKDLGKIANNADKIKTTFKMVNNTNRNILIDLIQTFCGCTLGKYSHALLRPKEKGYVELIIDLRNKRGHFSEQALVFFHGKNNPPVLLTVKGEKEW